METELQKLYKTTLSQAHEHYHEINQKSDKNNWKLDKDRDGMKTYIREDKATGLRMIKAEIIIAVPVSVIARTVSLAEDILKWDKSLSEHDIVEQTDSYKISIALSGKVLMVSQREALIISTVQQLEDGSTLVIGKSIDHPNYPLKKKYVRPYLHVFAWNIKPLQNDPEKSEVTYTLHVDPKGAIPKDLFNLGIETEAKKVKLIKKYLESHKSSRQDPTK